MRISSDQLKLWREAIGKLELSNLVGLVMETPSKHGVAALSRQRLAVAGQAISQLREISAGLPAIIAAGGFSTPEACVVMSSAGKSGRGRWMSAAVWSPCWRQKSEEKIRAFVRAVVCR